MLEAIQFETARRRGQHPHMSFPRPTCGSPGVAVKPAWLMREWALKREGDGELSSSHSSLLVFYGTDVDLSHLLSMLLARLRLDTLRMNTFSGDATPGKTKVYFEQWYHDVHCIKDHYLEAVACKSIIWLLKGPAVDMASCMGPTASIAHILQKLSIIFGMVVSFNVVMQNFYKVTQGNNEKVPSFVVQLEGTLNWIQFKCPGRMMEQHLKDHLFHGVCKHIHECLVLV